MAVRTHKRNRKRRLSGGNLQLVSLMDIFTILVFFLLVNSSSVEQLPNNKTIKLPESTAERLPKETLLIMINNDDIIVQGKKVASASQVMNSNDNVIPNLKKELQFLLQEKIQLFQEKDKPGEATVMGDKEIPYKLLKRILYTLSEANYKNISLAVVKKSESKEANSF